MNITNIYIYSMRRVLPKYKKIKNYILDQIHKGNWHPDDLIESENELVKRFKVSRMTVNRAVNDLTAEGVLTRRRGAGTYVAQKRFSNTFVTVRNIRSDIESMGKSYSAHLISKRRFPNLELPPAVAKIFQPHQNIFRIELLHLSNGVPMQFERRYVDLNLVPTFENLDFESVSPSAHLIKNVPLVNGHYEIKSLRCPKDVAQYLEMKEADPTLVLTRFTYSSEQPVTYVEMWYNGDNFSFSGDLD
ncbi:GntR family transcriptional regulator [Taylorella equigenitalis]|uniref:GntR family transcriptional regulator n=2 Tax=Taylorella equigenitalis TaxID=29575 RepID=UPI00247AF65F|nr:GntR family transcriptional regulator [Taylorella equigenitalis]WGQ18827.1 GntR family transcriptional regulator [Taylorella equigenitalis]